MTVDPHSRAFLEGVQRLKWDFYATIEPHRRALFGFCRRLTGDPFDAEDLHQETVLRAFAKLSERFEPLDNPKAYLFRIATNLWIDWSRREARRREEWGAAGDTEVRREPLTREVEDGASVLLHNLPPREAATLLLRDVFEYSVRETARITNTSEAAVKMATSRARRRLVDAVEPDTPAPPSTHALLERFAAAFKQRDIGALLALIDEHARARVLGCAEENGRDEIARGSLRYALESPAICDVTLETWQGRPLLAFWYDDQGRAIVRDLMRIEVRDGAIAALELYYFSPDVLREVCADCALPHRDNGYAAFERGWWNV